MTVVISKFLKPTKNLFLLKKTWLNPLNSKSSQSTHLTLNRSHNTFKRDRIMAIYYARAVHLPSSQVRERQGMHLIKFASCHHVFAPTKYENGFLKALVSFKRFPLKHFTFQVSFSLAKSDGFLKHKHCRVIKSKSVQRGREKVFPFLTFFHKAFILLFCLFSIISFRVSTLVFSVFVCDLIYLYIFISVYRNIGLKHPLFI